MHFGPETILVTLTAEFDPDQSSAALMQTVDDLQTAIRRHFPSVKYIYIDPETDQLPRSHAPPESIPLRSYIHPGSRVPHVSLLTRRFLRTAGCPIHARLHRAWVGNEDAWTARFTRRDLLALGSRCELKFL